MPAFANTWNAVFDPKDLPDLVASVREDSLNTYLREHRNNKKDRAAYRRIDVLKDTQTKKEFFRFDIIVGGTREEHEAQKADPVTIKLLDPPHMLSSLLWKSSVVYEYRSVQTLTPAPKDGSPPSPNAVIEASDVNFYFEWPSSSSGTPWKHHVPNIDFRLEAFLQLKEIDGPDGLHYALEIVPIRLHIDRDHMVLLKKGINKFSTDDKVTDLFLALIGYAASMIGPGLAQSIEIPVLKIEKHKLYPNLFAIRDSAINVGAKLDSVVIRSVEKEVDSFLDTFWLEVERDIRVAGGLEALVLTPESQLAVAALGHDATFDDFRGALQLIPKKDIAANFKLATRHISTMRDRIKSMEGQRNLTIHSPAAAGPKVNHGAGVGVSEHLLDTIVSKYGNLLRKGETGKLSLGLVRGWLAYKLSVGTIDISISNANGVTGSAPIDVWAGLIYQLRTLKGDWGKERPVGIGVKGSPKINVKTRSSSGLSLLFDFDLDDLDLYTGLGWPVDDLLGALDGLFFAAVEAVLDLIAVMMSFVVIPVAISMPGQDTKIVFSRFTTSAYSHPGASAGPRNNFLAIDVDVSAS